MNTGEEKNEAAGLTGLDRSLPCFWVASVVFLCREKYGKNG